MVISAELVAPHHHKARSGMYLSFSFNMLTFFSALGVLPPLLCKEEHGEKQRLLLLSKNNLNLLHHGLRNLFRCSLTTHISRARLRIRCHILYRPHQLVRHIVQRTLTNPPHHLRRRPERSHGIGNSLASDIWSRPVDRFEHGGILSGGVEVGGGCDADGAGESCCEVG